MSSARLSYRQQQAAGTRDRVTRAARQVFGRQGYGAATIAEIANAAGVAVPTMYKLFGNKRSLLMAVSDEWERQFAAPSPQDVPSGALEAIAWWAATVRRQWELGLDVGMIYVGAIASKPEVRQDLAPRLAARERAIRSVCEALRLVLDDRLTLDDAVAIISALTIPEVYRDLVRGRGWSPQAYEEWLERTLRLQLLATPPDRGPDVALRGKGPRPSGGKAHRK